MREPYHRPIVVKQPIVGVYACLECGTHFTAAHPATACSATCRSRLHRRRHGRKRAARP